MGPKMDLKQSIAGINHKYWCFMLIFVAKTQHFPLMLEDLSENSSILPKTQGFLPKTQGFSSKTQDFGNSRNLTCRKKHKKAWFRHFRGMVSGRKMSALYY